jgi:hypothetical protein
VLKEERFVRSKGCRATLVSSFCVRRETWGQPARFHGRSTLLGVRMPRFPARHGNTTSRKKEPHNTGLDLTEWLAAQSVPRPLCLRRHSAAQPHVMFMWEREAFRTLNSLHFPLPDGPISGACTAARHREGVRDGATSTLHRRTPIHREHSPFVERDFP